MFIALSRRTRLFADSSNFKNSYRLQSESIENTKKSRQTLKLAIVKNVPGSNWLHVSNHWKNKPMPSNLTLGWQSINCKKSFFSWYTLSKICRIQHYEFKNNHLTLTLKIPVERFKTLPKLIENKSSWNWIVWILPLNRRVLPSGESRERPHTASRWELGG